MRKVTKDEFYKEIFDKKLNVHPYYPGHTPPSTAFFNFPNGDEWGRSVPITNKYGRVIDYEWFIAD